MITFKSIHYSQNKEPVRTISRFMAVDKSAVPTQSLGQQRVGPNHTGHNRVSTFLCLDESLSSVYLRELLVACKEGIMTAGRKVVSQEGPTLSVSSCVMFLKGTGALYEVRGAVLGFFTSVRAVSCCSACVLDYLLSGDRLLL